MLKQSSDLPMVIMNCHAPYISKLNMDDAVTMYQNKLVSF